MIWKTLAATRVQRERTKSIPIGRPPASASSIAAICSIALLFAASSSLKLW